MGFDDVEDKPKGWIDQKQETIASKIPAKPMPHPVAAAPSEDEFSDAEIDAYMTNEMHEDSYDEVLCAMIYGKDGTAKSGISLDYLTDEDIKDGKRAVIIDLDGGNIPLLIKHHKKRCEDNKRKLKDVYIVKNPLYEENVNGDIVFNYKKTFSRVKGIIKWVRNNITKFKIKYVVFDGLSTALKHAEQQMRIDRHLAADGGVQLRYWMVRNKHFIESLEHIKSLPISKLFIAHEDFVLKDSDNSAVKEKTNAMMHQKIKCERLANGDHAEFKATIDKNKFSTATEGKSYVVCEVDNDKGKYTWNTKMLFDELM